MYISVTDDSYLYPASLLSDKSCTIMQAPCSVLLVPLILMALALLLPSNSQRLDNGPCHVPSLCILCTIPPHTPLGELSYLVSNSSSLETSFSVACGFVGLQGQDLILGSRVVSLQSPKLRPGWINSTAKVSSLDLALLMLQTMCGAAHLSRSCWLQNNALQSLIQFPGGLAWKHHDFLKPNNRLCLRFWPTKFPIQRSLDIRDPRVWIDIRVFNVPCQCAIL